MYGALTLCQALFLELYTYWFIPALQQPYEVLYFHLHFIHKKSEAQRSWLFKVHSEVARQELKPQQVTPKPVLLDLYQFKDTNVYQIVICSPNSQFHKIIQKKHTGKAYCYSTADEKALPIFKALLLSATTYWAATICQALNIHFFQLSQHDFPNL